MEKHRDDEVLGILQSLFTVAEGARRTDEGSVQVIVMAVLVLAVLECFITEATLCRKAEGCFVFRRHV
jgi:hypothetical protein